VAAAVKARRPDVRVVAVQAEEAAAFPGSLAAGRPVPLPSMATMADGIAVAAPGDLTLAHVRGLVDEGTLPAAVLNHTAITPEMPARSRQTRSYSVELTACQDVSGCIP
jgi:threonine dehydratase